MTPADLATLYAQRRVAWIEHARERGAKNYADAEDAVHDAIVMLLESPPTNDSLELPPLPGQTRPRGLIPNLIRRAADRVRIQEHRRGIVHEDRAHQPDTPSRDTVATTIAVQRAVETAGAAVGVEPWTIWRGLVAGETTRELAGGLDWATAARQLRRAKNRLAILLAPFDWKKDATKPLSGVRIG